MQDPLILPAMLGNILAGQESMLFSILEKLIQLFFFFQGDCYEAPLWCLAQMLAYLGTQQLYHY